MSDATASRAVAERVPTLLDEPIKVLQRRAPVRVAPGTTLAACLLAIQRTGTGDSVIVADSGGKLRGVLTERDIVARLIGSEIDLSQPVETLLNLKLTGVEVEEGVLFYEKAFGPAALPMERYYVVVQGIVRPHDVLRYLAEGFPEEVLNLPPRPHQRMKESEGA